MGKITEAKGEITWIEEPHIGYRCECGAELEIYEELNYGRTRNICDNCGRRYILIQTKTVYEVGE